jgi:hypothetical protein
MPLKGHDNEADFLIFYLMLIFIDFAADHGLINYIETKAKKLHFNHMLVFLTQLCELLTLQSSLRFNSSPPHPLTCVNKYKVCIHYRVCKGGLRQINTCRKVPLQVNF